MLLESVNTTPIQHLDFSEYEHFLTWEEDDFRLQLYDMHRYDGCHSMIAYRLYDEEHSAHSASEKKLVFQGIDFRASPLDSIDSAQTIASILSFLSLRPGDTDMEYFEGYTALQMEWCQQRAEYLALLALELEERIY